MDDELGKRLVYPAYKKMSDNYNSAKLKLQTALEKDYADYSADDFRDLIAEVKDMNENFREISKQYTAWCIKNGTVELLSTL